MVWFYFLFSFDARWRFFFNAIPWLLTFGEGSWYPFYRRLSGPQGRPGRVWKIFPSLGFDPRTFRPLANRYTDYAARTTSIRVGEVFFKVDGMLQFFKVFVWYQNVDFFVQ